MPRMFVMIHLPRVTGEVLSGFAVVTRNAPFPVNPFRTSMFATHGDAAELATVNIRNTVMLGQAFVDEGVVGSQ